jgi:hypothetical protein
MRSVRRVSFAEWLAWGLVAAALVALGALWHFDRTRVWESPRWDDTALVPLRLAEPGRAPLETWAVAVNPLCEHCRASLARGLALRRAVRAPVRLAVLVVDTRRRPSPATVEALGADELRWDSTGTWRSRWGHRVYGELLCFDRAGSYLRTLAPLADSIAARRALRIAAALSHGGGS